MVFTVKCVECGKSFAGFQARATHMKWIHENPRNKRCIICDKSFRDAHRLKSHVLLVHEKDKACDKLCPVCGCRFNKKCTRQHFQQHGIIIETETLKLDSVTFDKWKTQIEKETNSRFIKQRGKRNVKDEIEINEYCCHRSGNFTSKSKGIRTLKVKGSNKINAYCPAAIVTQSFTSGEVIVTFNKTHVGHENEVRRLSLTKEERAAIASKIAMRVPMKDILDEIRSSMGSSLSRKDLTTRKDIHNIIQSQKLNVSGVLHTETSVCVESPVAHLQASSSVSKTGSVSDLEIKKANLLKRLLEMVKTVKSSEGLQAFERHIDPLPFIINSAEEKAVACFPKTPEMTNEPQNRKLMPTEDVLFNKQKVCLQETKTLYVFKF